MKRTLVSISFLMACELALAQGNAYLPLRAQLSAVRESLVLLIAEQNLSKQDLQAQLQDRTDAVSHRLRGLNAPGAKKQQHAELIDLWHRYVKTYEQEFVPAVAARRQRDAAGIATALQRQRMVRMQQLLAELSRP